MFYKKIKRYAQYDIKDAKYGRTGHNGLKRDRNNCCAHIKRQLNRLVRAAGKLELYRYDHSEDVFEPIEDNFAEGSYFGQQFEYDDHDYECDDTYEYTHEEKWSENDNYNDLHEQYRYYA